MSGAPCAKSEAKLRKDGMNAYVAFWEEDVAALEVVTETLREHN